MQAGPQHTDDLVRFAIERDFAADHVQIRPKAPHPKLIVQNDHAVVARLIFCLEKGAAELCLHSEHRKKIGRDAGRRDALRLAVAGEIERDAAQ